MATSDYTFITQTGVIVADTAVIEGQVISEFKVAFGQDLNTAPDTPQGVLITGETLARQTVVRNNAALANQINPNLAGGVFLDAIWALTGGGRNPQIYSTALCNLTGVSGTVIPAGSLARDENGNVFASISIVTLDVDGLADVTFQAVIAGPLAAPAGTLDQIVSGLLGWETITNPDDAILGSVTQSDEASRFYRRNTLALQGSSLAEAITSALYATPGVRSVTFQENISSSIVVIRNVTMNPHSMYACVDGGTDTDVATSILSKKSGGCDYSATDTLQTVVVPVIEPASGQTFDVTFDRPDIIQILVRVTIAPNSSVTDPISAVKNSILDYANGLISGEPGLVTGAQVSPFELSGAINIENPSIFVRKVEVAYLLAPVYTTDTLFIEIFQKANISASSITVITS